MQVLNSYYCLYILYIFHAFPLYFSQTQRTTRFHHQNAASPFFPIPLDPLSHRGGCNPICPNDYVFLSHLPW